MKILFDALFDRGGVTRFFVSGAAARRKQALHWLEALHAEDMPEDQMMAYVEWMEADPRNAAEFHRMDQSWIASDVAREEMRSRVTASSGQDLPNESSPKAWPHLRPGFGLVPQLATACAVVLIAVFAFSGIDDTSKTQRFVTAVGEQRVIELTDGTEVSLNTESELATEYAESLRSVRLLKGQAYFNVASNTGRPFVVHLDEGDVEVVGTVFDVFKKPDGFSVTVLEGRVAVSPSQSSDPSGSVKTLILKRNERTEVSLQSAALEALTIDAEAATAWQTGQLIFRDRPLSEIITELSRYTDQNIRVAETGMEAIEFTGVLTLEDADLMVTRLSALLSLESDIDEDGSIVISRRAD